MSNNLEKIVSQFVSTYTARGKALWRVRMPDGHGAHIRKQGFPTKSLAAEWSLAQYGKLLEKRGQVEVAYTPLSFAEYAAQWIKDRKEEISPATYIKYQRDCLERRILPFFGSKRMVDVTKGLARQFLAELSRDDSITNSTRRLIFLVFKKIVRDAERDDLIPPSGIADLLGPRPNKTQAGFWDEPERIKFLKATEGHESYAIWKFVLFTGLRAGELAALRWDVVHFYGKPRGEVYGFVEVKRSRCQKTGKICEMTKNGDKRIVPIFTEVAEILSKIESRIGFVFGGSEPIDQKHLARDLRKVAKAAGVRPLTFHQLRHTFCSWMDTRGVARRIVSEIMGHRDLATTNRYSHVSDMTVLRSLEDFRTATTLRVEDDKDTTTLPRRA